MVKAHICFPGERELFILELFLLLLIEKRLMGRVENLQQILLQASAQGTSQKKLRKNIVDVHVYVTRPFPPPI